MDMQWRAIQSIENHSMPVYLNKAVVPLKCKISS